MGSFEIVGEVKREITYDIINIKIDFQAEADMASEASERAIKECERYLGELGSFGVDISEIRLYNDDVETANGYLDKAKKYKASRKIGIKTDFDMGIVNNLRLLLVEGKYQAEFDFSYSFSDIEKIRTEMLDEALQQAKNKAYDLAEKLGCKIEGIKNVVMGDKPEHLKEDVMHFEDGVFDRMLEAPRYFSSGYSKRLKAKSEEISEKVYTKWIIS